MSSSMRIRSLTDSDAERWDAFVDTCPEATFFHRAGWKRVVESAFGHSCYFLYAEREGQLQGVLPLGHVRSRLFGNALISAPFGVYGGVAAASDEAREALEARACALARELRAEYLELRYDDRPRHPDWPVQSELYVTFRKRIDPDPEVNLAAVPRKQRAMIRKGVKAGLRGEIDLGVERFYPVYAQSVRNLGTPVYSKRYFELLREVFGPACEVLTVVQDRVPVAAVLSFYFRDQVLPYYGGGTAASRGVKGNDFMYWDLMRRAAERGIRVFDYGRSKVDSGSYRFKKHWGFEPQPLFYEYYLHRAKRIPSLNPNNPKYRWLIGAWKRLPLPISMWLGPHIVRNLG
jgi:FemAB-related protein (PEP-CTERM system-associated)